MQQRLLLAACFLSLPLASWAQTSGTTPHFYAGVGASILTSTLFSPQYTAPTLIGPALTAGVQFTPRLAAQASLGVHWRRDHYSSDAYAPVSGSPATERLTQDVRTIALAVPVLLRYTFTTSRSPLQVDAVSGVTLLHYAYRNDVTRTTTAGQVTYQNQSNSTDTRIHASLGPAVRYLLSPNVELVASAPVSYLLNTTVVNNFNDRLLLTVLAGVHYRFGN
jgi:hypothetical protein